MRRTAVPYFRRISYAPRIGSLVAIFGIVAISGCGPSEGTESHSDRSSPMPIASHNSAGFVSDRDELRLSPARALQDARADIARGETRLYWVFENEGDLWNPPGITNCSPKTGALRPDEAGKFGAAPTDTPQGIRVAASIYTYKQRYNWAMVTLHPEVLHLSCVSGDAKISKIYRRGLPSEYDSFLYTEKLNGIR